MSVIEHPNGRNWTTLVVPTSKDTALPLNNEYVLDSRRTSDDYKGFSKYGGPYDYGVGTTLINSGDGCILRDPSGGHPTTTLPAGIVREYCNWVHNKIGRKYSYEFILENTNEKNSATVLNACESTTDIVWHAGSGTIAIDTTDKVEGTGSISTIDGVTDVAGNILYKYDPATVIDMSGSDFLTFAVKSDKATSAKVVIQDTTGNYKKWTNFSVLSDVWTRFVLPIKAPMGTTGQLPDDVLGTLDLANIDFVSIGVGGLTSNETCNVKVDDICLDTGKWCRVETMVPDELLGNSNVPDEYSAGKYNIYTHDGTSYVRTGNTDADSIGGIVDSQDMFYLDGITSQDINGFSDGSKAGGLSLYKKDIQSNSIGLATSTSVFRTDPDAPSNVTLSNNNGTKYRTAIAVELPPSDNGRTEINKTKLKMEVYYDADANGIMGAATHEFTLDETDVSTSLKMMHKPWVALLDEENRFVDYLIFKQKPTALSYTTDDDGHIVRLDIDGEVIHQDKIYYSNILKDSDADAIPNSLTGGINEITKYMDFVYDYVIKYNVSPSVVTNDFGLTLGNDGCDAYMWLPEDVKVSTNTDTIVNGNFVGYKCTNLSELIVHESVETIGDVKYYEGTNRIYDSDHIFQDTCTIDNDVVRVEIGELFKIYFADVEQYSITPIIGGHQLLYSKLLDVEDFTTDKVKVKIKLHDISNVFYQTLYLTIYHGQSTIYFEPIGSIDTVTDIIFSGHVAAYDINGELSNAIVPAGNYINLKNANLVDAWFVQLNRDVTFNKHVLFASSEYDFQNIIFSENINAPILQSENGIDNIKNTPYIFTFDDPRRAMCKIDTTKQYKKV